MDTIKKVALFFSDLHLGKNDSLDEFHCDKDFKALLDQISNDHKSDEIDLVLLGDVLDLWAVELEGEQRDCKVALDTELRKVEEIVNAHREVFKALGEFLSERIAERRLYYIFGNHDHSVCHPEIQKRISMEIKRGGNGITEEQIQFRTYYLSPELKVYAEHGNQHADLGVQAYTQFDSLDKECPGYYDYFYIGRPIEKQRGDLDNVLERVIYSPRSWPGIIWWTITRMNLKLFRLWREGHKRYAEFLRENPDLALRARSGLRVLGHIIWTRRQWGDELIPAIRGMFNLRAKTFPYLPHLPPVPLDPSNVETVILGHTHIAYEREVKVGRGQTVHYYNLGSWLYRPDGFDPNPNIDQQQSRKRIERAEPCYVIVEPDDRGIKPQFVRLIGEIGSLTRLVPERKWRVLWRDLWELPRGVGVWIGMTFVAAVLMWGLIFPVLTIKPFQPKLINYYYYLQGLTYTFVGILLVEFLLGLAILVSPKWLKTYLFRSFGNLYWFGWRCPAWMVRNFRGYQVKGIHYRDLKRCLEPGDILLNRFEGYFDKYFIPGWWNHAGIVVGKNHEGQEEKGKNEHGDEIVVHAIGKGVIAEDILNFMRTDHLAVLRPIGLSVEEREKAIGNVIDKIGKEYDFKLDFGNAKQLCCTELVFYAYKDCRHKLRFYLKPHGMLWFKQQALTPDDIFQLTDKGTFELVWMCKEGKVISERRKNRVVRLNGRREMDKAA